MRILISGLLLILFAGCSSVTTRPETIQQSQTIQVTVLGWIKSPGDYSLRAHANLAEALEAAGGFRDIGHNDTLNIVRTIDGQKETFSVRLHYIEGRPESDFELINGDKIYAHEAFL